MLFYDWRPGHTGPDNENENDNENDHENDKVKNARPRLVEMTKGLVTQAR